MSLAKSKWVDPRLIRFKISPHHDLEGIKGGDWDIDRRHPVEESAKHKAIRAHFIDGVPWENTELFADLYRRRFEQGDRVRDATNIEDLAAQYYDRVDGLYHHMKRHGFQTSLAVNHLPNLFIGRNGEVFIGNQGNHRLAIAQILGLKRIAGNVICRHKLTA